MKIDLEQLIYALSDTVDLVGVDEILHGKRVAFMAWECAKTMGLDRRRKKELFHIGLLHDCGISSTREHRIVIDEMDWEDSSVHCQLGATRIQQFKPLAFMADTILHHHSHWQTLHESDLPEQTRVNANFIYLLDRVDAFASSCENNNYLKEKEKICSRIVSLKNTYFHPDLVDIFLETSKCDAFWFTMKPMPLMEFYRRHEQRRREVSVSREELKTMAELFAQIVDAKSPYTAEHSFGVGQLSRHLAELCGLDQNSIKKIEVAGLLHDLGKLQVPDDILEKSGKLDREDLIFMRHHSYGTLRILQKIRGMEEIALWAANHHEALDGSGYPFGKMGDELDLQSRIIIVADIFQALAQNRPYRGPQPLEKIVAILQEGAFWGKLDEDVVGLVVDNTEDCFQEATIFS